MLVKNVTIVTKRTIHVNLKSVLQVQNSLLYPGTIVNSVNHIKAKNAGRGTNSYQFYFE